MSRAMQTLFGVLLALVGMAGIVALSRAPYDTGKGDRAVVRLSWSGRPQRIERCRELTEAELAERPVHMRRRLECEGRPARYLVRVAVDGRTVSVDTVTGGGLRGDRAIHMLREFRVEPGRRAIAMEIARVEAIEEDVEEDEERERQEVLPARVELAQPVTLEAGSVALVTYDPTGRRLVLVTGPRR